MDYILTKEYKLEVLRTPMNGDCLYSALAHQLFESIPFSEDNTNQAFELRKKVADFIEKNGSQYKNQILSNLLDMESYPITHGNKQNLVRDFCNLLRQPGFWGGGETIKAISQLYLVSILIFMEDEGIITFNPPNASVRELHLAYRKSNDGFNHYDSIQKIIDLKENSKNLPKTFHYVSTGPNHQMGIRAIKEMQNPGYIVLPNDNMSQNRYCSNYKGLKIATWNVRGCSHPEKRNKIDDALHFLKIDIAGIQETHLSSGIGETPHYHWWNAGREARGRESRGVAMAINKNLDLEINEFHALSDSICSITIQWKKYLTTIITAHISNETDPRNKIHLADLNKALSIAKPSNSIILLGDLNAHFAPIEKGKKEGKWIGPKVAHQKTNDNGRYVKMLMEIFNLTLHNSWSQSNTVLTTWSNGNSQSQLDHILSTFSTKTITFIKAKWVKTVESDHKILYGIIKEDEIGATNTRVKLTKSGKRKWDTGVLNNPYFKEKYQNEINIGLQQIDLVSDHPKKVEDYWNVIKATISEAASNSLAVQRSPITPRRRKIIANQKQARFLRHRYPQEEELRLNLVIANNKRKEANRIHFIDKCSMFINNLKSVHPQQRIKELYNLIKCHKQSIANNKLNYIPISKWEELLHKESGPIMELIEEKDGLPLPPPPSYTLISKWIGAGKKGRVPGIDNINLELLAYAPSRLIDEIVTILKEAWERNEVPKEWNTSIQVPIPKTKNPKGISNYRRIALCNVMYKLYSKHILHCLDNILPETPAYQAAYLPDRSTDDHTFTAGRVLEERWKGGLKTYVVALDLEKAFDSVQHKAIVSILKRLKIPHKLINRIIKSSLNEQTMIQWCGQRSNSINKGVGVKQGCPLSPRMFNLAIDEVLQTLAEILPYINLQQNNRTSLPFILVFADDILIIADSEYEIQEMINELIGLLDSIGLKINSSKCQMLIRDPSAIIPQIGKVQIENQTLTTVKSLRYLGVLISNSLNRHSYVRERIKKAYISAHSILPFLKRNHLPWKLTKNIYELTIVPIVTYGLKTSVITKANRKRLRYMERDLIKLLAHTCHPKVHSLNSNILLKRKTIIRKISLLRIRYWGHIIRRAEGHILRTAMSFQTKKRKIGRPCLTWISSLEKDKKKYKNLDIDWPIILMEKNKTAVISKEIFELPDSSDSEDIDWDTK